MTYTVGLPVRHRVPAYHGGVVATLAVHNSEEAETLRKALEEAMREGARHQVVFETWLSLRNMRWRAFRDEWVGWA